MNLLSVLSILLLACSVYSDSIPSQSNNIEDLEYNSITPIGNGHRVKRGLVLELGYARRWWGCLFSLFSNPGCFRELKETRRKYARELWNTPVSLNPFRRRNNNVQETSSTPIRRNSASSRFNPNNLQTWTFYNESDILNSPGFPLQSSNEQSTVKPFSLFNRSGSSKPSLLRNLKEFIRARLLRRFNINNNDNNNDLRST